MTVGKGHREPHCYSLGSRLLFLSLPLSLADRTAAAKHTNWAVQPPLLHLHLLIHLCTQGRSTQIETSASLKKKKTHHFAPSTIQPNRFSHRIRGSATQESFSLLLQQRQSEAQSLWGCACRDLLGSALCRTHNISKSRRVRRELCDSFY